MGPLHISSKRAFMGLSCLDAPETLCMRPRLRSWAARDKGVPKANSRVYGLDRRYLSFLRSRSDSTNKPAVHTAPRPIRTRQNLAARSRCSLQSARPLRGWSRLRQSHPASRHGRTYGGVLSVAPGRLHVLACVATCRAKGDHDEACLSRSAQPLHQPSRDLHNEALRALNVLSRHSGF